MNSAGRKWPVAQAATASGLRVWLTIELFPSSCHPVYTSIVSIQATTLMPGEAALSCAAEFTCVVHHGHERKQVQLASLEVQPGRAAHVTHASSSQMKTRSPLESTASVPCHFSIVTSGNSFSTAMSAAVNVPSGPVSVRLVCTEAGTVAHECFGHLQLVQFGCGGGAGPSGGGGGGACRAASDAGSASVTVRASSSSSFSSGSGGAAVAMGMAAVRALHNLSSLSSTFHYHCQTYS